MLKQKSRPAASTRVVQQVSANRTLSLQIRTWANTLPINSLIYAMTHALSSKVVQSSPNRNLTLHKSRAAMHINELIELSKDTKRMNAMDGALLYRYIKASARSYVDLFYCMSNDDRKAYVGTYVPSTTSVKKRAGKESNILLIPAMMALKGEPKGNVINFLVNNFYRMPFRVLYHSGTAAMHLEMLQQALGIGSITGGITNGFSASLKALSDKMTEIEDGRIRPEDDEAVKRSFVEQTIEFASGAHTNVSLFINEMTLPNTVTEKTAKKIMRKL